MLKVKWVYESQENFEETAAPMEVLEQFFPGIGSLSNQEFESEKSVLDAVWEFLGKFDGPPESCPMETIEKWEEECLLESLEFVWFDSSTGEEVGREMFASD